MSNEVLIEVMEAKLLGIRESINALLAVEKEHLAYIETLKNQDKKEVKT